MSKTGEYCGDMVGATIKKLPLFGEQVEDDEINFEWPTKEDFDKMRPDVTLQSMEFAYYWD